MRESKLWVGVSAWRRVESMEKVSPVEKRYEPQISPSSQYGPPASGIPPSTLPKLNPSDGKLSNSTPTRKGTFN